MKVEAYLQDAFGPERFKSIAAALCTPPAATCLRVNTGRATPQEVIQQLLQTPALAAAGVTPHVHPAVPMAVILPHGAPPGGPVPWAACAGKRVVVSRKAGESLLRGAAVYAPGVLAATSGISRGDLVAVGVAVERPGSSAMPVTRGTTLPLLDLEAPLLQEEHAEAGAGAGAGAEAGEAGEVSAAGGGGKRSSNRAARIKEATDCWGRYVGLGRACMSRNEMFHAQQGTAVALEHPVFLALPCSGLLPPGTAMLQNLPSIVAALTLAPRPGAAVLDMCAAPGGKATLLAQLMGGVGRVVALDRTHAKVGGWGPTCT